MREKVEKVEKVEAALDKIRPDLQADGGDAELVDIQDGVATVRLTGACIGACDGGCPMSTMTFRMEVERVIREEVPEIKKVVAV